MCRSRDADEVHAACICALKGVDHALCAEFNPCLGYLGLHLAFHKRTGVDLKLSCLLGFLGTDLILSSRPI